MRRSLQITCAGARKDGEPCRAYGTHEYGGHHYCVQHFPPTYPVRDKKSRLQMVQFAQEVVRKAAAYDHLVKILSEDPHLPIARFAVVSILNDFRMEDRHDIR